MKPQPALEWTKDVVVLHAVSREHFNSSIIHLHGKMNDDLIYRGLQDLSHIGFKLHEICSFIKLPYHVLIKVAGRLALTICAGLAPVCLIPGWSRRLFALR